MFHNVCHVIVCIFGSPYFGYLIIIRGVIWKDDDGEEEDDDEGNEWIWSGGNETRAPLA